MSTGSIADALQQAKAQLKPLINNALNNEVFDVVAVNEEEAIAGIVYSTPTSGRYRRRGSSGGLGDENNVVIAGGSASNGVLTVENQTPVNPFLNGINAAGGISKNASGTFLAPIVETGSGYDYHSPGPRPFTKSVIEQLGSSKEHISALKAGLIRQGVKVE